MRLRSCRTRGSASIVACAAVAVLEMRGSAMNILTIPTVYRRKAWLDREALRIKANVKGASLEAVTSSVFRECRSRGVAEVDAIRDAEEVETYILTRIAQLDDLMDMAPWEGWRRLGNG